MAITKRELPELVRDLKSGGDASIEGKYHPNIINKIADMVIGGLIAADMFKNQESNGYEINGDFLTPFVNVPVLNDVDRDEKYSVLPAAVISLKQNRGMYRVSAMQDKEFGFSQVPVGSHDIFRILEAHYISKRTEFYLERNRIYYRKIGLTVDKVLIKMVAAITNLDPDQPIAIPASMEGEFLDTILKFLDDPKSVNQDKANDSNSNTIQR